MKECTMEDLKRLGEALKRWDEFSDQEKHEVAVSLEPNANEAELTSLLKFIEWLRAKKWRGFSEQQKLEIIASHPRGEDVTHSIENAARTYIETVASEQDLKKEAEIVALCVRLNEKVKQAESTFYQEQFQALRVALDPIAARVGRHRRVQPKDNARQDARSRYMEELLGEWVHADGQLGGAESPMIAFFRAAWPHPLLRHRPSNDPIVQWVYKHERTTDGIVRGLLHRHDKLKAARDEQERSRAARELQKYESRHDVSIRALFAQSRIKNRPGS
jgi:hypothetical protein